MKVIEPCFEILDDLDQQSLAVRIEVCGRICYKSEDKIVDGAVLSLVKRFLDSGHLAMIEFGHDIVVKFISNRGFTHELVRHRVASFAQESTRNCNYSGGKFGSKITCIDPTEMLNQKVSELGRAHV